MFKTGEFRQYEYEKEKNMKLYNSERPAHYEIWNITCPTVFFWGQGDVVNTPLDVDITAMLWNKESLTEHRRAVRNSFSHLGEKLLSHILSAKIMSL
jgi:pimeloyl-ACP methyl ester carboxylesterase